MAQDRYAVLSDSVRTLNPGCFALVMATGIVSIAMQNHGLDAVSRTLFVIAAICYVALVLITGWRLIAFRGNVAADLKDPRRAFGFFTFVAGSDVLGTCLVIRGHTGWALGLLLVGSASWLFLGYVVPWSVLLRGARRPVLADANGTWFIWVVASASIAVLAAALEPILVAGRRELALLAVVSWSVGVFLYAAAGVFVTARMLLYPLTPQDLTPPYFVAMGATAITVVAGARIVQMADAPMVEATRGLAAGVSVVFWAFGTWLIPVLLAAGAWRHFVRHVPLRYETPLWSVVFPLGMYSVGSHYLGRADRLPLVEAIGSWESWLALAAWTVTFVAMLGHLSRRLIWAPSGPAADSVPERDDDLSAAGR